MAAYVIARTLEEALEARASRPVTVLAGGTDVYPARAGRVGWGNMQRDDILDIGRLAELRGAVVTVAGIRFGALTTWSEIARADLPPAFAGLQAAAREVGGAQVQNRGTLAGNLCTASPAGDGIPCLLSLDASVELASTAGRRTVPLAAFIDGYRHTVLRPDEIVTAVEVPAPPAGEIGGFVKLGARRYLVISIAMIAATLEVGDDGRIRRARIAVGACAPVACRLDRLEHRLAGVAASDAPSMVAADDLSALDPIDDVRASADYRRDAALVLVRDLLGRLGNTTQRRAA